MTGYKLMNKYVLVRPMSTKQIMDNGIKINMESVDRKKIVRGTVIGCASNALVEGSLVVFPLYAADIYTSDNGEVLWLIKSDDIMMSEKAA